MTSYRTKKSQCERFMTPLGMKLLPWDDEENDYGEEVMKQEGNYFISMSPVGTSSNTKNILLLMMRSETQKVEKKSFKLLTLNIHKFLLFCAKMLYYQCDSIKLCIRYDYALSINERKSQESFNQR